MCLSSGPSRCIVFALAFGPHSRPSRCVVRLEVYDNYYQCAGYDYENFAFYLDFGFHFRYTLDFSWWSLFSLCLLRSSLIGEVICYMARARTTWSIRDFQDTLHYFYRTGFQTSSPAQGENKEPQQAIFPSQQNSNNISPLISVKALLNSQESLFAKR